MLIKMNRLQMWDTLVKCTQMKAARLLAGATQMIMKLVIMDLSL